MNPIRRPALPSASEPAEVVSSVQPPRVDASRRHAAWEDEQAALRCAREGGRSSFMEHLIAQCFGTVSAQLRDRLRTADQVQLAAWGLCGIDARAIADLLQKRGQSTETSGTRAKLD
ncbi:hypothetical protein [Bordetella genomosp. 13]|uniref:hypothetical protein n=1 Tax=Bordetella genomosp. 13 TaxID=463040 RepID=UPI0012FAE252|nr:hypothetical protein [Bordetella genomosp. 13]